MLNTILTQDELKQFASYGKNVQIDSSVKFFNPQNIHIGNNVRIDSWCIISTSNVISIGNNVHIAAYVQINGSGADIVIGNFCGLSARVSLFTATDDYTDGYLTGPTIPEEYKKITKGSIILKDHVIIGSGSVILPGCTLYTGSSIGALSLINKDVEEYSVMAGIPIKFIRMRDKNRLHEMEKKFLLSKND